MPETLPYSPAQNPEVKINNQQMAQYLVRATIAQEQGNSLSGIISAIRTNQELRELDSAVQAEAVQALTQAGAGHEFSTVAQLDQGVLGMNRIGTKETYVSADVVADAATSNNTEQLQQVLEHENTGHGNQTKDTQDIVGKNGEVISVWQQREGHAEHVSNPHGRREGQPRDYAAAQDAFEENNTTVLSSYITGRVNFITAQAAILRNSRLSYEDQEAALDTANVQHDVAQRILFAVHGTRNRYINGPKGEKSMAA